MPGHALATRQGQPWPGSREVAPDRGRQTKAPSEKAMPSTSPWTQLRHGTSHGTESPWPLAVPMAMPWAGGKSCGVLAAILLAACRHTSAQALATSLLAYACFAFVFVHTFAFCLRFVVLLGPCTASIGTSLLVCAYFVFVFERVFVFCLCVVPGATTKRSAMSSFRSILAVQLYFVQICFFALLQSEGLHVPRLCSLCPLLKRSE